MTLFINCIFQSRFLKKLQGEKYYNQLVSEEECKQKLEELTQGMLLVYQYSQGKWAGVY